MSSYTKIHILFYWSLICSYWVSLTSTVVWLLTLDSHCFLRWTRMVTSHAAVFSWHWSSYIEHSQSIKPENEWKDQIKKVSCLLLKHTYSKLLHLPSHSVSTMFLTLIFSLLLYGIYLRKSIVNSQYNSIAKEMIINKYQWVMHASKKKKIKPRPSDKWGNQGK